MTGKWLSSRDGCSEGLGEGDGLKDSAEGSAVDWALGIEEERDGGDE